MAHTLSKRVRGTTPYYNLIRRVAFPSTRALVISSIVVAILGVGLSFLIAKRSIDSFLVGSAWGIMIFIVPYFIADIVLYLKMMKDDPLFYFRRCLALSFFAMTTWVVVFLVSSGLALALPSFIFPDFAVIIGLFAVILVRAVAIFSMSRVNFAKRTFFTLLEPTLTVLVVIFLFGLTPWRMVFGLVLASLVGLTFAFALVICVEVYGRKALGFSPTRMFRAFLADWLEAKNDDLESYLTELGVESEIDVSAFAFRAQQSAKMKAIFLVSNFHPGPFTNVGSSVLPFLFERIVEEKYGAIGLVPHGASGHELNLVSQAQNAKVINWALSSIENAAYKKEATPVLRSTNPIATATSQVFDGCALVTMTTAPDDMEDIPSEIGNQIVKLGQQTFSHVALIDAHNCLTGPITMTPEKLTSLQEAALATLQISAQRQTHRFKVGVAKRTTNAFGLQDGIGPGGVKTLVIETEGQRFAYVLVDGNNMIKGLREQLLDKVKKLGFNDAEVMTTDTHMVNGVVHAPLGYRIVGEVVPWDFMEAEVTAACQTAITDLEDSEVAVVSGQIPVTTIGSKSLKRVMRVVYRISKLTALTLFPMIVIVIALSLLFLV